DGLRRGRPPAAAEPQERTGRESGARKWAACVPGEAGRARCRAPAGEVEGAEISPRGCGRCYRRPPRPLDADGWARPEPVVQAAVHELAIAYHWPPRAAGAAELWNKVIRDRRRRQAGAGGGSLFR
ncbi:hypothetical protein, partial [Burkholderia contaminans]|uniref:hypothetical protein n=1 Tax=Burkholderia contaminans TaxID=488447 RepID=UPI001C2E8D64